MLFWLDKSNGVADIENAMNELRRISDINMIDDLIIIVPDINLNNIILGFDTKIKDNSEIRFIITKYVAKMLDSRVNKTPEIYFPELNEENLDNKFKLLIEEGYKKSGFSRDSNFLIYNVHGFYIPPANLARIVRTVAFFSAGKIEL